MDTVRENMGSLVQNVAELLVNLHTKIPRSCVLDTGVMVNFLYSTFIYQP